MEKIEKERPDGTHSSTIKSYWDKVDVKRIIEKTKNIKVHRKHPIAKGLIISIIILVLMAAVLVVDYTQGIIPVPDTFTTEMRSYNETIYETEVIEETTTQEFSYEAVLDKPFRLNLKEMTFNGSLLKALHDGTWEHYIVDDFDNRVRLKYKTTTYQGANFEELFTENQLSEEAYSAKGVFLDDYFGPMIEIKTLTPINRTTTNVRVEKKIARIIEHQEEVEVPVEEQRSLTQILVDGFSKTNDEDCPDGCIIAGVPTLTPEPEYY
ncbi:MAG: hypothetical protein ABIH34_01410 [Nanoarchaeota archaeon]